MRKIVRFLKFNLSLKLESKLYNINSRKLIACKIYLIYSNHLSRQCKASDNHCQIIVEQTSRSWQMLCTCLTAASQLHAKYKKTHSLLLCLELVTRHITLLQPPKWFPLYIVLYPPLYLLTLNSRLLIGQCQLTYISYEVHFAGS